MTFTMTICHRLSAIAVFFLAALSPQIALSWGSDGHRLVAMLADQDLSPRARIAVGRLLNGSDLADVSTWMDDVRSERQFSFMKRWHFVNINVCHPQRAQCAGGDCAPERIKWAQTELRSSDPGRQLFALKVLVHLVGDIHQPLHAADNGDGGGNGVQVSNRSCGRYGCDLHVYWDSYLVRNLMRGRSQSAVLSELHNLSTSSSPEVDTQDPYSWALESEQVAASVAYAFPGFSCGQNDSASLNDSYDLHATSAIKLQLAKAGRRLARILNKAFTS